MTATLPPIDDERLTAFALNEVDAAEGARIEAHLTNDPSARKTVDDIRATAGLLADELKQERFADLARAKPVATMPRVVAAQPSRKWTWVASAAALVTIGLLGATYFGNSWSPLAKRAEMASCMEATPSNVSRRDALKPEFKYSEKEKLQQSKEISEDFRITQADLEKARSQKTKENPSTTFDQITSSVNKKTQADNPIFSGYATSKTVPSPVTVAPVNDTTSLNANTASGVKIPLVESSTFGSRSGRGAGFPAIILDGKDVERVTSREKAPPTMSTPAKPALDVPQGVLDRVNLDDHFEIVKTERPDTKSAYGNPDATKIFHAVAESSKREDKKKLEPNIFDDLNRVSSKIKDADQAVSKNGKKVEPTHDIDQRTTPSAKKPDSGDIAVITIHGNYSKTPPQPPIVQSGGEAYPVLPENEFESVRNAPLSTFSADVDTAAYSNVRRFLGQGQLPPPEAVRVEELINYFKYNYTMEKTADPFSTSVESAACPWNTAHRLVRVAVKSHDLVENKRPQSNFVFLIDVSGSMDAPNRLPLVKDGMKSLVRRLGETDRVAIVTYAGESGVPLQSTNCSDKERILNVIDSLQASGSTNGGAGIQTAYSVAKNNFIKGGLNRVILATDGDFNVGVTSPEALVKMIENESQSGVFLTALGYGMGNYKDAMLQKLADKGHGNYAYIDNAEESRKALVEQMNSTLVAVAKDVKFQVEFNPARASEYRLIGYEKRAMPAQDFNNDSKDAGVLGAGHTVTAFYEIVMTGTRGTPGIDGLKYQAHPAEPVNTDASPELLTVKIRYKSPEGNVSKRLEIPFTDKGEGFERASSEFKFAASVALFGQVLRRSQLIGNAGMKHVIDWADDCRGPDEGGYRREFIQLARKAAELRGER